MLRPLPLDEILNIVYEHVAVSAKCNELTGQHQWKAGLATSPGVALGTSGTFSGGLIA